MAATYPSEQTIDIAVLGQLVERADRSLRGLVRETPAELAPDIVGEASVGLFLKREDLQETGSFKIRGATNKVLSLTQEELALGLVAASNGNHGLGVAAAAKRVGARTRVFVSRHVSSAKVEKITSLGAEICREGEDPLQAELAARKAAERDGQVFISPYNDFQVMAGQGTIAAELHRQVPDLNAVFVAVGGGGLIGGIGAYLKHFCPSTEVIGCWPENSPVMLECIKAGRIIDVSEQPTLSESTAGGLERGSVTLSVCSRVIDRSVLVSEEEVLSAMKLVRKTNGALVEGAAGVALAAFLKDRQRYKGKAVAVVICGGNLSPAVRSRMA